jgi:hypothetical protein
LLVVAVVAAGLGALPFWPIDALLGLLTITAVVVIKVRHTQPHSRVSRCSTRSESSPRGFRERARDRPDYLIVPRRLPLLRGNPIRVPVEQVVEVDLECRRVVVYGAPVGPIRWKQAQERKSRRRSARSPRA